MTRVVLIHGVATDSRVWTSTIRAFGRLSNSEMLDILAPDRPQSGNMDTEIAFLTPLCAGAFIIGVSGGATLGLELAARGVPLEGALLHEPAAGSLAPGLLQHVKEALATNGVEGFGQALYGSAWTSDYTFATRETVEKEFAMFGGFEPKPLLAENLFDVPNRNVPNRIVLTVGEKSPPARYASVQALSEFLNIPWRVFPGVGHAAHLEGGFTDPVAAVPELFTDTTDA